MSRPRKPNSSVIKTAKKRKDKICRNQPIQKLYFDETIEILDSDDDFKIPNPSIRKRLSEKTKSQLDCPCPTTSFYEVDINVSDTHHSFSDVHEWDLVKFSTNIIPGPGQAHAQKETLDKKHCSLNHQTERNKDSWKNLMQRMQNNQKSSQCVPFIKNASSKKSNKSLNQSKKPVHTISAFTTKAVFSKSSNSVSSAHGEYVSFAVLKEDFHGDLTLRQSQKKPKLDFSDIDESDIVEMTSSSKSSLSSAAAAAGFNSNDSIELHQFETIPLSTSANANQDIVKKVPLMFMKPSERAALAQARKLEKSVVCNDLCNALKLLSTEPVQFDSATQSEEMLDGNIVKLYKSAPGNGNYDNSSSSAPTKTKACPFYKKLPGTRFSVDAFNYGQIPGIEVYFLSHFHSDHYIGLTKKFCKTLVCSPPTANLLRMKLNVDETCIRRLQINTPYIIDDVEVTLINANHCPGSVMFVFKLPTGTTYFHTGDFRFSLEMLENHIFQGLKIDCLYLDTTYCDPRFDFPTQEKAIAELITVVKRKLQSSPKTLIVCGSYVIGKERVYFSLAEAIKTKVFMNYDKRRVIQCLENPRYASYLAEREDLAGIHVQQMFSLTPKFLSEYLATRSGKYTNIIGIKPTGWQFTSSGDEGSSIKTTFNGTVTIIGVPYSEHSSFSELEQFVRAIKPNKIQPTVNVGSATKREAMMRHINQWLCN